MIKSSIFIWILNLIICDGISHYNYYPFNEYYIRTSIDSYYNYKTIHEDIIYREKFNSFNQQDSTFGTYAHRDIYYNKYSLPDSIIFYYLDKDLNFPNESIYFKYRIEERKIFIDCLMDEKTIKISIDFDEYQIISNTKKDQMKILWDYENDGIVSIEKYEKKLFTDKLMHMWQYDNNKVLLEIDNRTWMYDNPMSMYKPNPYIVYSYETNAIRKLKNVGWGVYESIQDKFIKNHNNFELISDSGYSLIIDEHGHNVSRVNGNIVLIEYEYIDK